MTLRELLVKLQEMPIERLDCPVYLAGEDHCVGEVQEVYVGEAAVGSSNKGVIWLEP